MKVDVRVPSTTSLDIHLPGNVQGDEFVARAWCKYLARRPDVETVALNGDVTYDIGGDGRRYAVHFYPFLDLVDGAINALYLQNAFPEPAWPGGTPGVFAGVRDKFAAHMFLSPTQRAVCEGDGPVIPFAADHELFTLMPPEERYAHSAAFVGNNIRGAEANARYLLPLGDRLVVYGNADAWAGSGVNCRGKLPASDEPILYSSAAVNLNAHLAEHTAYGVINYRIYCILACGGRVLSDHHRATADTFGDAVSFTAGGPELVADWERLAAQPADREANRELVIGRHTFVERVDALVSFLRQL